MITITDPIKDMEILEEAMRHGNTVTLYDKTWDRPYIIGKIARIENSGNLVRVDIKNYYDCNMERFMAGSFVYYFEMTESCSLEFRIEAIYEKNGDKYIKKEGEKMLLYNMIGIDSKEKKIVAEQRVFCDSVVEGDRIFCIDNADVLKKVKKEDLQIIGQILGEIHANKNRT